MQRYALLTVFLWVFLFCGANVSAQAVAAPEPALNACDRSVLTPESRAKSGWTSVSGGPWVAFNMERGFALCLSGNRYLVFSEQLKGLESVSASTETLVVRTAAASGEKTEYVFKISALNSGIESYQGEAASRLSSARLVYAKDAVVPYSVLLPLPEGRVDGDFNARCLQFASDNWLWSNKSVLGRLKVWLSAELAKKKPQELEDCAPSVALKLDIPRSRLPKYLEVVAHRKGKDPVSAVFRAPAAELLCENESGRNFREVLPEGELLKVFR